MSQQFAQISDPHLTTLAQTSTRELLNKRALGYLSWIRKRRHEHRAEVLDALQQDLRDQMFDQLLITGDLTHIGLPSEFQQARAWLEQLGSPTDIALVPGNHDACVAAPWEDTFALWQEYMAADNSAVNGRPAGQFPTLRVRGALAFIGVSTGVPKPPLMATGTVGREQLQKLATVLRSVAEQGLFRVVYLHHCPVRGHETWRKRLTDVRQTQSVLEENGVELVVHGHGHRSHFTRISTRDGVAPVIAVPSASALGLHGADVAHYNRYEVDETSGGWQLNIKSRIYDRAAGMFVEGDSSSMQLVRRKHEN